MLAVVLPAGARTLLAPSRMHDDFEGAGLSGWSSYPPVQDAGYDPSLTPVAESAVNGRWALARVVQPPSPGVMRLGFLKRLGMRSSGKVSLTFAYRVKPSIDGVIEAAIAGGDGRRYVAKVRTTASRAGWTQAALEFDGIPEGVELQALSIIMRQELADPDTVYRFLIDDVDLRAASAAGFDVRVPVTRAIAPWAARVSGSTYVAGESIAIEAVAPVELSAVACTVRDAEGNAAAPVALTFRNGVWSNARVHTLAAGEPSGVWTVELVGHTRTGDDVRTAVRVLVRPKREHVRPSLWFDASEQGALLKRSRDEKFAPLWDRIVESATKSRKSGDLVAGGSMMALLDPEFLLPTLPGYFDIITRASVRLFDNALVAVVTGDEQARATARQTLLEVSHWNSWAPPWFAAHGQFTYYPAGELARQVAFAYDSLHPTLSPADKSTMREAIVRHAIEPAYREYVLNDRIAASTSNWIGHSVGGALLAAVAVSEPADDTELNLMLGGLLLKLEDHLAASYLDDGSYGEGISYQEFDLATTTLALEALQRVYGIDYWRHSHITKSLGYPMSLITDPVKAGMDMGDSHPPSGYSSALVVRHAGDPLTRWYFSHFEHRSFMDFLFPVEGSVEPSPGMTSRIFERRGNALFRSGSDAANAIVLFRAGPNFNHNHADQGSFLVRAFGESMVTEAGYADYYKDPHYGTYFTQAAGHNTVLVNGDPGSQDVADTAQFPAFNTYPKLEDTITSKFYDAAAAELTSVYRERLSRYTRRIVYLKPGYLVIHDDMEAREPSTFNFLLHVGDRSHLRTFDGGADYQGTKAAMSVRTMIPANAAVQSRDGHIPYGVFNPVAPAITPPMPGVLDIGTRIAARDGRFLVVLTLAPDAVEAQAASKRLATIAGEGCTGVLAGGAAVLFRNSGAAKSGYNDWRSDGAAWTVGSEIVAAEAATTITRGGKVRFQSDQPLSFAAHYSADKVEFSVAAEQPVIVRLYTGFLPTGFAAEDYNRVEGTLRIRIPAGRMERWLMK